MKSIFRRTDIIIFLFGFLLYANTFLHEFVLDDAIVFSENIFTKSGIEGWTGIFTKDTFYGFFQQEGKEQLVAGGRYRPFSLATFALEVSIFGVQPISGHIINALLYGVLGIVIFRCLLLLRMNRGLSLAITLLFVAHPLHTEVVANIKGRDEIFSLFFSMLALYFFIKHLRESSPVYLIWVGIFYFLGLMSKENSLTFLAIFPLVTWYIGIKEWKKVAFGLLPTLLGVGIFLWIRWRVIGPIDLSPSMEWMNNPFLKVQDQSYLFMDFWERTALILQSWIKYQQLLIFPFPLSHDYYPLALPEVKMSHPVVVFSLLLHVSMLVLMIIFRSKKKDFTFGMLFFWICFSMVSNVVFPIGTHLSERFMFMPSLGWIIAITSLTRQWLPQSMHKIILGVVLVVFASLSIARNSSWKNNYILFSNDIKVVPNSAKLNNALGGVLIEKSLGGERIDEEILKQALIYLERAVVIHPNYKNAHLLKGNANLYLKLFEKAVEDYQNALAIDANYQEALNNISIAYRDGGRYYGEQEGNLQKAIEWLQRSAQMRSDDYEVYRLLGVAYGSSGNNEEALKWFLRAVDLEPENGSAWYNLAIAYFNLGLMDQGADSMERAKQLDPTL
jgi:tetratricopeptide (TPR) repeat protein